MKRGVVKLCKRNGCKREFYEYPYQKRFFCSTDCANKANATRNSKSKLGNKNPMYGKKPWNKGIIGVIKHPSNSGSKCHFWRGGISREKYKLRRSAKWKAWRLAVFERDNYACRRCRRRGGSLIPHHIKLFAYFVKERFKLNNGVTVCEVCHKHLHRKENQRKKIININD